MIQNSERNLRGSLNQSQSRERGNSGHESRSRGPGSPGMKADYQGFPRTVEAVANSGQGGSSASSRRASNADGRSNQPAVNSGAGKLVKSSFASLYKPPAKGVA